MEWVFAQLEPLLKRSPMLFLALVAFFYCPGYLVGPEVAAFRQNYAGVVFLLICLTGASTVFRICGWAVRKVCSWRADRDMTWFDYLSPREQSFLADMYLSRRPTALVAADALEVKKLMAVGYLVRCGSSTLSGCETLIPVTLNPFCSRRLGRNKAKLKRAGFS